jgi:hypothetical protein
LGVNPATFRKLGAKGQQDAKAPSPNLRRRSRAFATSR